MNNTPDRLLTPDETAERLAISPATLAVWRCTNRYPLAYVKIGRAIRYRAEDVERFIADRTVMPAEV